MSDDKSDVTDSRETGNTLLLAGGGFAAYGTTMAVTAGFVCGVCVVATPLLLGVGAYQKYKHVKSKASPDSKNAQED